MRRRATAAVGTARARAIAAFWLAAAIGLASPATTAQPGPQRVHFPSLDGAGNAPVMLAGLWMPLPTASAGPLAVGGSPRAPAAVLLHGCGGAWEKNGQLARRLRDYAELVHRAGLHVLVLDSFGPRQEIELCTQKNGSRRVNQSHRRLDALAAIGWLAARDDVDPARIGLIGWSHGGSTVLAATNLNQRDVREAATRPAFAVAFYPGCSAERARRYEGAAPLLLLIGDADDWTPVAPCDALVREARQAGEGKPIDYERYRGAFHGFDSDAPVRVRTDVPNGVRPGAGVHVGGDPAAREDAREKLQRFLAQHATAG
jgi:dienelactone hydrolase